MWWILLAVLSITRTCSSTDVYDDENVDILKKILRNEPDAFQNITKSNSEGFDATTQLVAKESDGKDTVDIEDSILDSLDTTKQHIIATTEAINKGESKTNTRNTGKLSETENVNKNQDSISTEADGRIQDKYKYKDATEFLSNTDDLPKGYKLSPQYKPVMATTAIKNEYVLQNAKPIDTFNTEYEDPDYVQKGFNLQGGKGIDNDVSNSNAENEKKRLLNVPEHLKHQYSPAMFVERPVQDNFKDKKTDSPVVSVDTPFLPLNMNYTNPVTVININSGKTNTSLVIALPIVNNNMISLQNSGSRTFVTNKKFSYKGNKTVSSNKSKKAPKPLTDVEIAKQIRKKIRDSVDHVKIVTTKKPPSSLNKKDWILCGIYLEC